jgi:uncharacterized membrane protein required for colicin V production
MALALRSLPLETSGVTMKFDVTNINWVDFLTVIVLLIGIMRGRKRGLSEELLDTIQWLAIIFTCAFFYQPLGAAMAAKPVLSTLTYYLVAYIGIALAIKLVFTFIKRRVGEKLVGSDMFGGAEYYLGMIAGTIRFACIYLFLLNLLHAPYYSPETLAAVAQAQQKNFGDISFPTLGSLQQTFFKKSLTGQATEKYLALVLIKPAAGDARDLRSNSLAAKRQRAVDDIFGGK